MVIQRYFAESGVYFAKLGRIFAEFEDVFAEHMEYFAGFTSYFAKPFLKPRKQTPSLVVPSPVC